MRVNRLLVILGLTFSVLFGSGASVAADFDKGLSAYDAGDYNAALAEWVPIAEQGNLDAQLKLASIYRSHQGMKNSKKAVKWFTKAAEQGHMKSHWRLGDMYIRGEGVLESYKTAIKWYTRAAQQGDATAQRRLGGMYQDGMGVLTDNIRAYMWFILFAYNAAGASASDATKSIAKEMDSAEINKAQEMASICLESNYTDC